MFLVVYLNPKVSNSQKHCLVIGGKVINYRKQHITVMININRTYSI